MVAPGENAEVCAIGSDPIDLRVVAEQQQWVQVGLAGESVTIQRELLRALAAERAPCVPTELAARAGQWPVGLAFIQVLASPSIRGQYVPGRKRKFTCREKSKSLFILIILIIFKSLKQASQGFQLNLPLETVCNF